MVEPEQPPAPAGARDDSRMSRFERRGARRFRARDAVLATLLCALLLVVLQGESIRHTAEQQNPGIGRTLLLAVGRPAGAIAGALPFERIAGDATRWLSPDRSLQHLPGFTEPVAASGTTQVPPITTDAFDSTTLGLPAPPRRPLHTLLVTGDSLSSPLDQFIAQRLAAHGVRVIRDPHVGTGISNSFIVDWAQLSESQVQQYHPDGVVVFIGANEGFPMPGAGGVQLQCCSVEWATVYAARVRRVMSTLRRQGAAYVYWLTVPTPRDPARQRIARVVNAAVTVAAQPWADDVRVLDTVSIFTPGGTYRDAMTIGGARTLVRQADGIHLNDAGSSYLAGLILPRLAQDFRWG